MKKEKVSVTPTVYDSVKSALKLGFNNLTIGKQVGVSGWTIAKIRDSKNYAEYKETIRTKNPASIRQVEEMMASVKQLEQRVLEIQNRINLLEAKNL